MFEYAKWMKLQMVNKDW